MTNPTHNPPATFYLVLHGLISIIETDNDLQLYLIDMGTVHQYCGGNWGAYTDIKKGSSGKLVGVKAGNAGVDEVANPVVKISAVPAATSANVYATFTVPKPRKLHSLDRGNIQIKSGADLLVGNPATLSGVRVLEYEVETTLDSVALNFGTDLADQFWTAGFSSARLDFSRYFATLHLSNNPPVDGAVPGTHNVDEFTVSCQVLGANNVQIAEAVQAETTPNTELPLGPSRIELGLAFPVPPLGDHMGGGGCNACCGGADAKVGGGA